MSTENKGSLASFLIVAASLAVTVLVLLVAVFRENRLILWALLLSGVIGILSAGNLDDLLPSTRKILLFAGIAAILVSVILLSVLH